VLRESLERGAAAVETLLARGLEAAMNACNAAAGTPEAGRPLHPGTPA
jgi:hypothetical protein